LKAWVDSEKCQGHTLCAMRAPEVFTLSDIDGHATAIEGELPKEFEADVLEARGSCPEQAITIED
jgi:ferredoxin